MPGPAPVAPDSPAGAPIAPGSTPEPNGNGNTPGAPVHGPAQQDHADNNLDSVARVLFPP